MNWTYRIVGRSLTQPGEETYTGACVGETAKAALKTALEAEFGELFESGWIEQEYFDEQYHYVVEEQGEWQLACEDHEFFVYVQPA